MPPVQHEAAEQTVKIPKQLRGLAVKIRRSSRWRNGCSSFLQYFDYRRDWRSCQ